MFGKIKFNAEMRVRLLMCVLGVLISGISVGFFKFSLFGVDPFQCFMGGLHSVISLEFGLIYALANAVMLVVIFILDKHYIGLATLINLFFLGYVAQYTQEFLGSVLDNGSLATRIICMVVGIGILSVASSFYFTADLGVSTYDAIALFISKKQTKIRFGIVRVCTDLICVVTGVVLFLVSGKGVSNLREIIGVGTIVTAFFMGPLIEFFNEKVSGPMLAKYAEK